MTIRGVRLSTIVLSVFFAGVLTLYVFVRPLGPTPAAARGTYAPPTIETTSTQPTTTTTTPSPTPPATIGPTPASTPAPALTPASPSLSPGTSVTPPPAYDLRC